MGAPPAPTNVATILPGGKASIPAGAPYPVVRAIKAANKIHRRTYIWGGGHRSFKAKGYDCSGAVSYVLHAAGVLGSPLVSGQLASWGSPGPGSWITVYANRTHTYMVIAGLRYDTSPRGEWIDQGRGPRWRFTLRTPTGVRDPPLGRPLSAPSGDSCEQLLTAPDRLLAFRAFKRRISSPPVRDENGGTKAVGANPPRGGRRRLFQRQPVS